MYEHETTVLQQQHGSSYAWAAFAETRSAARSMFTYEAQLLL